MAQAASAAWKAAETAARDSYGRLISWLAYQWRDVQAAEDALADAFVAALRSWPVNGVPDSPDAWLMTAAKRNLLQMARHRRVAFDPAVTLLLEEAPVAAPELPVIPDQRLKLLFVCAHPAIEASLRPALMLQTVLGLEAQQISAAFLLSPAAMAQRLVRAKKKIRDAGLRFEEPEPAQLPERIHSVLEAIYAAYGLGWEAAGLLDDHAAELADEALFLTQLTSELLPDSAEAAGLFALILFCESRRAARHGAQGEFVPLHQQDCSRWDRIAMARAERLLWRASVLRQPGPFQLEAAIQSAHCQRAITGSVPWTAIAQLYANLLAIAPTLGATVGRAVALAEAGSPTAGIAALDHIDAADVAGYQPYWVARAHLLCLLGDHAPARDCFRRAIGLTVLPAVRDHLQTRLERVGPAL